MGIKIEDIRVQCPECGEIQTTEEVSMTTEDDDIMWGCPNDGCPPSDTHPFNFSNTATAKEDE